MAVFRHTSLLDIDMPLTSLRPLGRSGIGVSPLCLGGNVFGWTADEPTSFAILDAFVDAGGNFIDTADVYSRWAPGHSGGESETVIGRWLARSGKRSKVVIATKVGMDMGPQRKGLSPAWIERAVDESLKRLGIDCIDLYQSHTDDADTPIADTLGAYARLIEKGKIRAIGASNFGAARLAEALAAAGLARPPAHVSLQPLHNPYHPAGFGGELGPLCQREGIAVLNYYSLAAGFLTGKYRSEADLSKSPRGAGVGKKYLNPRGLKILAALDEVAARLASTPGNVALAWLLAQPVVTSPIVSASSVEQLRQIAAAADLVLDAPAIAALDAASAE